MESLLAEEPYELIAHAKLGTYPSIQFLNLILFLKYLVTEVPKIILVNMEEVTLV